MKALSLIICVLASTAFASPEHHKAPVTSSEFEKIKALVGTWEGKTKEGDKDMTAKAVYELTSAGTAVVEKLFPGTPHEMTTIYSSNGKKTKLTHFCAAGNQPEMALKKATPEAYWFELTGNHGIASAKEAHMHSLNLKFTSNDSITQEWSYFENGKQKATTVITLNRKK